ncbi:MAG: putative quinol monooxygenase [Isosphaeraceae bacterium]
MIHVIATIEVKPGRRPDFLAEFHRLVPQVRAEDGCIEYGPTVDADTGIGAQVGPRGNVVVVVEKWASIDHLKAHLAAPHMNVYREAVKDMLVGLELVILDPA